ncbi:questin oxidase family protein [Actinacidiphila paucisporea]|uniref:DUF4243 domain-containing protein n=1 Tax=Actinacidiphila paucisporea TaxID=310782 RepID=A0A1M7QYE1_9ACTN|nr:questin oxidase family protein [Actinacidiphila paucisporea]SHN37137.1 Protein of unknown function [Actinacidiphila paucisporea]
MTALTYTDAMGGALERLRFVGYEHGTMLVNHAPMAAEAMATLGYADDIATWVEGNLAHRRYKDLPTPRFPLTASDETDWRPALGDFDRVTDWWELFDRELADAPWQQVLARWWPRLLPGMSGVMTHGVIRTAHAVRAIAHTPTGGTGSDEVEEAYRRELAHGLGYWAARYSLRDAAALQRTEPAPPAGESAGPDRETGGGSDAALAALDELVADACGHYAATTAGHPVPLIHAITGPAAVRLVLPHLPADQQWASYLAARHCSAGIRGYYGPPTARTTARTTHDPQRAHDPQGGQGGQGVGGVPAGQLVAEAVELGDEHAIKLAEVAVRHQALLPDDRYAAAANAATRRLRGFLSAHSFYD